MLLVQFIQHTNNTTNKVKQAGIEVKPAKVKSPTTPTTMQLPRRVLSRLQVPFSPRTQTALTPKYIRLSSKDYSRVSPSFQVPLMMSMRTYCCQQTSLPRDVTTKQLVDILANKTAVVVDVRTPEELTRHGTIPGAINIPLGDLEVTSQGQH